MKSPRDVAMLWLTLSAGLIYLDVPSPHAFWFSTNILIHGAIGSLVLARILNRQTISMFLFCGPALAIGGAIAVTIFLGVGRGTPATWLLLLLGSLALIPLLSNRSSKGTAMERSSGLAPLCGLSALGMSSQYHWLLFVAIAYFFISMRSDSENLMSRMNYLTRAALLAVSLGMGIWFRGDSWWLISDDYQLFEVLARHIAAEGPFVKWGTLDISRYHWLSYGWSGLLDLSSGSPEQLVTLTRVMPVLYSLILGSSLLAISETLAIRQEPSTADLLPAWAVAAGIRIDWSAPSTAGAFSIVVALLATLVVGTKAELPLLRRIVIYMGFFCILLLTKLPAALVLLPLIFGNEYLARSRAHRDSSKLAITSALIVVGGVTALGLLQPLSYMLGEFRLVWMSEDVIRFSEPLKVFLSAIAYKSWLILPIVMSAVMMFRDAPIPEKTKARSLLIGIGFLYPIGAVIAAIIPGTSKANLHEYFSGPNYALALCVPLALTALPQTSDLASFKSRVGLTWIALACAVLVLEGLTRRLIESESTTPIVLREAATDSRTIFGVVVLSFVANRNRPICKARVPVNVFLALLIWTSVAPTARELVSRGPDSRLAEAEVSQIVGSSDLIAIGKWLDSNSGREDRVATNRLFDNSDLGSYGDEYALAMWARRQFIVLGPKFFGQSESAKPEIELSLAFANNPDSQSANALKQLGVRWFVVDTNLTSHRSWYPYGRTRLQKGSLWVIELVTSY